VIHTLGSSIPNPVIGGYMFMLDCAIWSLEWEVLKFCERSWC